MFDPSPRSRSGAPASPATCRMGAGDDPDPRGPRGTGPRRDRPDGTLAALRERARPTSERHTHLLPVAPAWARLLPGGGLRRGTTVRVDAGPAGGATTAALALVAAASTAGSWCVAVGFPDLGVVAAQELGLDLDRVAVVPRPGGHWPQVVATLVEEVDVVVLRPPTRVAGTRARQLAARVRHCRAVLVLLGASRWPEPCDVVLDVAQARWVGIEPGHGRLHGRLATVTATSRRGDTRPRRAHLWLPGPDGAVRVAADRPEPAGGIPGPAADHPEPADGIPGPAADHPEPAAGIPGPAPGVPADDPAALRAVTRSTA